MKPYYRRISFRPGQRFFLNVNGKIEQYKFVQASYTYDGSVSIIAEPRLIPGERMTLLAQRGFVRREFRKVEKGGTYDHCCIFSGFDRIRTIGMWCGIYFSRRAAKKGICTEKLWEQNFQEIIARRMTAQEQQVSSLLGTLSQAFCRASRLDPVIAAQQRKQLRETTKSLIQGTASDVMTATVNAPTEYRFSKPGPIEKPLPRRMFDWPAPIVVRQGEFPIIKGGV